MVHNQNGLTERQKAMAVVFSILIFLLLGLVAALFAQNQALKSKLGLATFRLGSVKTCTYNGKTYQVGESIPSIDNCNSCSCTETGEVTCTAMACDKEIEQPRKLSIDDWETHIISEGDFSFKTPANTKVTSEVQSIIETGKTTGLTLYIERNIAGQPDYYQLYGLYQWDLNLNQRSFTDLKKELEPNSIEIFAVSDYPSLSGQIKGERNRFVTFIITNKGILSLFTSEPTMQNKKLTDQIISTFQFLD